MNKKDGVLSGLLSLGMDKAEAAVYVELLKRPATHAQLSSAVNINRTTLYRVIHKLEKQGIVAVQADDRGKFLVAADPSTLEVNVVNQEVLAKQQRNTFAHLLPTLEAMQTGVDADFLIKTYQGIDGFKRMLWHELKAKGDCLCIGTGTLEDLVPSKQWAERHRQLCAEAGYVVREIVNPGTVPEPFTPNQDFLGIYQQRIVPRSALKINYIITTYNHTVAIYHTYHDHRRGLEITSRLFAATVRSMFEYYWATGEDPAAPNV